MPDKMYGRWTQRNNVESSAMKSIGPLDYVFTSKAFRPHENNIHTQILTPCSNRRVRVSVAKDDVFYVKIAPENSVSAALRPHKFI